MSDLAKVINYFLQGKGEQKREDFFRRLREKFSTCTVEMKAESQAVPEWPKIANYFVKGRGKGQDGDIYRRLSEAFTDSALEVVAEMQAPSVLLDRSSFEGWKRDYLEGLDGVPDELPPEIMSKIFCANEGT